MSEPSAAQWGEARGGPVLAEHRQVGSISRARQVVEEALAAWRRRRDRPSDRIPTI